MLGKNKLLLQIGQHTLLRRTAIEIERQNFCEIWAVTGHDKSKIEQELMGLKINRVFNPHFSLGLHSSIKAGIKALQYESEAFFVCLADQPKFSQKILNQMMSSWLENPGILLLRPSFQMEPGHPVLISSSFIPEIIGHPDGDFGCNYLFQRYPHQALVLEMTEDVCLDLDSPLDYKNFLQRGLG